jgi:hypothetical protein
VRGAWYLAVGAVLGSVALFAAQPRAQLINFFEYENLAGRSFAATTTIDDSEHFGLNDGAPSVRMAGDAPSPGTDWSNAAVVLYELDQFSGRNFATSTAVDNLADVFFYDRASSIYIRRGNWQFCSDAFYFGQCQVLGPGVYRNLESMGLSNRISSLRPGDGVSGGPGDGADTARITIYDRPAISGQSATFAADVNDLAHVGFENRVRSIDVAAGRWTLCTQAFFRGECRTFGPGRYASLGSLSGRVLSMRRA